MANDQDPIVVMIPKDEQRRAALLREMREAIVKQQISLELEHLLFQVYQKIGGR